MSVLPVSRRHVMAAVSSGIVTAAAMSSDVALAQGRPARTFVLVPGAWHGAWCYRRVADILAARGHKVFAISLTGLADRKHLASDAVDMSMHVTDVVNLVDYENLEDIVLVGHSYGGLVITGVAEKIQPKISSIVYLDAFIPANNQSMADIVNRSLPATGFAPPFPAKAMAVNEKDQDWVNAKMTPQPIRTYLEKMQISGAYEKIARKTYIRATRFTQPLFDPIFERLSKDSSWKTFRIDSGHDVMVDAPQELSTRLMEVA